MIERTEQDYKQMMQRLQEALAQFAVMVAEYDDVDLQAALDTVLRAEAVGPIFHPSEYIAAVQDNRLARQKQLLTLVMLIRSELFNLFPNDEFIKAMRGT